MFEKHGYLYLNWKQAYVILLHGRTKRENAKIKINIALKQIKMNRKNLIPKNWKSIGGCASIIENVNTINIKENIPYAIKKN